MTFRASVVPADRSHGAAMNVAEVGRQAGNSRSLPARQPDRSCNRWLRFWLLPISGFGGPTWPSHGDRLHGAMTRGAWRLSVDSRKLRSRSLYSILLIASNAPWHSASAPLALFAGAAAVISVPGDPPVNQLCTQLHLDVLLRRSLLAAAPAPRACRYSGWCHLPFMILPLYSTARARLDRQTLRSRRRAPALSLRVVFLLGIIRALVFILRGRISA